MRDVIQCWGVGEVFHDAVVQFGGPEVIQGVHIFIWGYEVDILRGGGGFSLDIELLGCVTGVLRFTGVLIVCFRCKSLVWRVGVRLVKYETFAYVPWGTWALY